MSETPSRKRGNTGEHDAQRTLETESMPALPPFGTEAPTIATVDEIRAAAERRNQWAKHATRELAEHPLINQAMASVSWEAVARKSAEPLASVEQIWYSTARQVTAVLDAAGLPHSRSEDWRTPEAQEALAQAELIGLPSIPEAREFGEIKLREYQKTILDALQEPRTRHWAAHALLIEAWVSVAGDTYRAEKEITPARITAVLEERFSTNEGWTWITTLHLDMAEMWQNRNTLPQPPAFTPAFDDDGYGRIPNDVIASGARRAFSAAPSRWKPDGEGFPVFVHANSKGKALYSPSRTIFPTARDAMRVVETYGGAHVALLKYITAKHLANSAAHKTGPYGGFYMSVEEFLDVRGIKKHPNGGHKPGNRREVIDLVRALSQLEVSGSVEGYMKDSRGKQSSLTIRSPLIVISHTVSRRTLAGEEIPIAWYLRPGDWAADLEQLSPQFALTTRALLQLNIQSDMHAFNLGNYLAEEYRIRAHQRSWQQPYRIKTLLADAEIEVDRAHAGRFRQRIETALDVLTNPVDMKGTPIIESWYYPKPIETQGRGWLDKWLDSGIVITPPNSFIEPYQAMGSRRRTGKSRKIAG